MILKINYDSKNWYVDILKFSLTLQYSKIRFVIIVLQNLVCHDGVLKFSRYDSKIQFDMIPKINYDPKDWYDDILKNSIS